MSTLTASKPLTKGITIARDMPSWGMPSLFVLTRCKTGGSGSFSPAPCTTRGPGLGDAQDSSCPHEVNEKAASEFGVGYAARLTPLRTAFIGSTSLGFAS